MTTFAYRFDLLVTAMRRATATGRRRLLATHRRLVQRGVRLPSIPPGYRVVAGQLMPLDSERQECRRPT
jgi:hypothetical protein